MTPLDRGLASMNHFSGMAPKEGANHGQLMDTYGLTAEQAALRAHRRHAPRQPGMAWQRREHLKKDVDLRCATARCQHHVCLARPDLS